MSNFRFGYTYTGKFQETERIAKKLHDSLEGNPDYISSAILLSWMPNGSVVSVEIWPQELNGIIPDFLRDYLSFVTFCDKALQEDNND